MAGDDLNAPLGYVAETPALTTPIARDLPWGAFALGGMALIAASLVGFVAVTGDGSGGYPRIVVPIEPVTQQQRIIVPDRAPMRAPVDLDTTASIATPMREGADQVETQSGVKVVRRGGGSAPGALIIRVPDELGVRLTPAPDPRLVEKGPHGPLPRIGRDGARPSELYARPLILPASIRAGAPRVAIVVGGMGLSRTATAGAIEKLPAAVTLAFAPYGVDLDRQAAEARSAGHEILLQVPMEGFGDKPDAGGPRVLKASSSAEKTLDSLHWHMSRFAGYVGVMNFLGGRFTSSQAALAPVMRDLADRGLAYLDDGSSPQSRAPALANAASVASARADVVLDASQRVEDIEAALQRLEALAREKGSAIGVASGLPSTVDHVGRFADKLATRGIALVPLTSLIASSARTSER